MHSAPLGPASRLRAPLFVPLAALLLYALRFPYSFGASDQGEFVPFLLHLLDPSILSADWFVAGQQASLSVRAPFVWLLWALSQLLPVHVAVLVVYGATWGGLAFAVYALAQLLLKDRLAAAAAVFVALVLTPQWTLGGNDLVHSMLVPSMAGWSLGLWGLVMLWRGRVMIAVVLIGVATWMQALVGLQLALLCGVTLLLQQSRRKELLRAAPIWLALALPILIPVAMQQTGETAPSQYYILAEFRAPHHYLFFSFPSATLVKFGILLAAGLAGFAVLRRRLAAEHRIMLRNLLLGILACCTLAFLGTEVIPLLGVAQLQLFKTTVLAKLLLVILACGAAIVYLPGRRRLNRAFAPAGWSVCVLLALWLVVARGPEIREEAPVARVEAWARMHTAADAVFAVPPSWSGFRSRAERAIVVNFKAFPFHPTRNMAWFQRVTDLAPITLPARGYPALPDSLDAAFFRLPSTHLQRLASQYAFDYVVRAGAFPEESPAYTEVFAAGAWTVYRAMEATP